MGKDKIRRFKKYMRRTYRNKLAASLVLAVGSILGYCLDSIGIVIVCSIFFLPIFFVSKDVMM